MDIEIECFDKGDYVLVKVAGPWTQATVCEVLDAARDKAVACDVRRILLDLRDFSVPDSDFSRYMLGKYAAEALGSRYRVAGIGKPENITYYAEKVARNRGMLLRPFVDEEAAINWLLE
jgi:hypothetical protein